MGKSLEEIVMESLDVIEIGVASLLVASAMNYDALPPGFRDYIPYTINIFPISATARYLLNLWHDFRNNEDKYRDPFYFLMSPPLHIAKSVGKSLFNVGKGLVFGFILGLYTYYVNLNIHRQEPFKIFLGH